VKFGFTNGGVYKISRNGVAANLSGLQVMKFGIANSKFLKFFF